MTLFSKSARRVLSVSRCLLFIFPRPLWERVRVRGIQSTKAPSPHSSPVEGEEVKIGARFFSLFIVASIIGVGLCEVYSADKEITVLSYPERPAKLPLWLAQEAGLFEKFGLKVEIKPA